MRKAFGIAHFIDFGIDLPDEVGEDEFGHVVATWNPCESEPKRELAKRVLEQISKAHAEGLLVVYRTHYYPTWHKKHVVAVHFEFSAVGQALIHIANL